MSRAVLHTAEVAWADKRLTIRRDTFAAWTAGEAMSKGYRFARTMLAMGKARTYRIRLKSTVKVQ